MFNAGFTELLLVWLAAMLIVAAIIDVRTFTISNRLNLAVAAGSSTLLAVDCACALARHGDPARRGRNRLRPARRRLLCRDDGRRRCEARRGACLVVLARRHNEIPGFHVLAGGVLTIALLAWHRSRGRKGRPEIPYGVAIAFGGLAILAQRFLNQFA